MVVVGIDPGVSRIGFGVLGFVRGKFSYIQSGLFKIKSKEQSMRLLTIRKETLNLIKRHKPDLVGVEKLFFNKNKKTGMAVSEARGVVIEAIVSAGAGFVEMTPPQIKALVSGDGKATKDGIARMVGRTLDLNTKGLIDDETDALAVAIAATMMNLPRKLSS